MSENSYNETDIKRSLEVASTPVTQANSASYLMWDGK